MHDADRKSGRDPQAIADEAGRIFSAEDRGTLFFGAELVSIGPGRAAYEGHPFRLDLE